MSIIKFCDSKFPSSSTLRCSKFLRLAPCSTTAFVAVEPALTLLSAWRSSNSKPIANRKKSQGLIALPSTTLYYKACTSISQHYFVLTTKLAQTTSQYYFVLQDLHKARPSTTLNYNACTKHFPVLLCTTKLAKSTSQYFVLPSLDKARSSTTLYYKACTNHVPALLCTTQSLHPVLLCTTKLAQTTS